jgi:ubiquinone/menaquinone biosynthesis C-methylase UbiE
MTSASRRYFAEDFASTSEDERLAVLAGNYDPSSFRLLEDCGLVSGWTCAEVGAGTGSVAAWLADALGPEASIVALDIETSHLDHLASRPNVAVRQHDIVAEPIGDSDFDLVHTRLVIEHLPEPKRLLEMLARATRPGGLLVVECTDMLATAAADPSDPRSRPFDEFMAASFAAVESLSTMDFGFARRLPQLFEQLGFEDSQSRVTGRVARGGDTKALEYALGFLPMRSTFIERGFTTADEIDAYLACLADPDFWFVANNVIAASGRRPT